MRNTTVTMHELENLVINNQFRAIADVKEVSDSFDIESKVITTNTALTSFILFRIALHRAGFDISIESAIKLYNGKPSDISNLTIGTILEEDEKVKDFKMYALLYDLPTLEKVAEEYTSINIAKDEYSHYNLDMDIISIGNNVLILDIEKAKEKNSLTYKITDRQHIGNLVRLLSTAHVAKIGSTYNLESLHPFKAFGVRFMQHHLKKLEEYYQLLAYRNIAITQ